MDDTKLKEKIKAQLAEIGIFEFGGTFTIAFNGRTVLVSEKSTNRKKTLKPPKPIY